MGLSTYMDNREGDSLGSDMDLWRSVEDKASAGCLAY